MSQDLETGPESFRTMPRSRSATAVCRIEAVGRAEQASDEAGIMAAE